ncbi:cytochrome P450 [Planobispora rosea]|uniref:Cytochrome P450 n=1 Tax=Planobispora rosea TaxID=35762 RepID=A0A8J3WCL8_PLARO|nr:cytochrome P450 [Planobispora rosea]GGS52107.1 cytochrome P450 [Planobispora rosea]GIH83011.1 cytochrome P450 [Planobispora rosea]
MTQNPEISGLPEVPLRRTCPFDPPPGLAELRATSPVTRRVMPLDGTELWLVTNHDLVRRMLADPRWSSSLDGGLSPEQPLHVAEPEPGMFISMDAPEHGRYRRMLTAHFTVQRMNRLRPRIEQIVAERLDAMERLPRPVDLVAEFALPVPSLVICELLGMPYEDRAEFQEAARVIVATGASPEEADAAVGRLAAHLGKLIAAKRAEPDDALISGLIREGTLTDGELVQISMLLLVAGHETTANMLGLGTLLLFHHPDQLALVREGAPGAADELLRYLSIVDLVMFRGAKEDLTLGGQEIRAGEFALASLSAANRDPALCEDPDRLDVTRPKTAHVALGYGPHQCLGQNLARLELEIALQALLRRFPGLRAAVPLEEVPVRENAAIHGLHSLPVTW